VWDEERKKWVNKNGEEEDEGPAAAAPPSDFELSRTNSEANFGQQPDGSAALAPSPTAAAAPPMPPVMGGGNKFAGGLAKKRGGRAGRIDVFKASQSAPVLNDGSGLPPPALAPPPAAPMPMMTPAPALTEEETAAMPQGAGDNTTSAAPQFFNPNDFSASSGGVPKTKRSLHAAT